MSTAVHPAPGTRRWIRRHGRSAVETCRLAQLHAAERDERVFSLEADLGDFGGLPFRDRFPTRYLDMGIAEASLIGAAAGIAMRGKVPFVNTFGSFALMRACEQVRVDVAYHRSNVKIAGTFAGIAAAYSGPTHHCLEDIAIARALPNMQARHEHVNRVHRCRRWALAPELVDEPVDAHDLIGVQRKEGQQRPLPRSAQGDGKPAVDADLEWSENPQLQDGPHPVHGTGPFVSDSTVLYVCNYSGD